MKNVLSMETKLHLYDVIDYVAAPALTEAPFYTIAVTSQRCDSHSGTDCCLHYATVIRYVPRSENLSA